MNELAKLGVKERLHPRLEEAMISRGHQVGDRGSVRKLAAAIGVSAPTLYNCLGGRSTASAEVAILIAEELSLSLKDMREIFLVKRAGTNFAQSDTLSRVGLNVKNS